MFLLQKVILILFIFFTLNCSGAASSWVSTSTLTGFTTGFLSSRGDFFRSGDFFLSGDLFLSGDFFRSGDFLLSGDRLRSGDFLLSGDFLRSGDLERRLSLLSELEYFFDLSSLSLDLLLLCLKQVPNVTHYVV